MRVIDVVCSEGKTGFYFDDQRAIKKGACQDGFTYVGDCVTAGFSQIRQSGESISVMLVLEDGQVAYGDCAAVQYSGAGGRDPLFLAKDFIPIIDQEIAPKLIHRSMNEFRKLAEEIDRMEINGKRLHIAIRYGVTQAILDAVAKSKRLTMAEVVQQEYCTGVPLKRIPIFTQSGDDRYLNVDKMILKGADVLPHGLINHVDTKLGSQGEKLLEYVDWLKKRLEKLRTSNDKDFIMHLDVYGTIGIAFDNDTERMATYMKKLQQAANPFRIRIEGPMDVENREEQVAHLKKLREQLKVEEISVDVVADEWCNTLEDIKLFADEKAADMIQIKTPDLGGVNNIIEAILYCKDKNIGAYCGGTCNETDRSAQVCTHIAMACGADQCLAKPGMGCDEGFMIVNNEMNRVLALASRNQKNQIGLPS